ncbi:tetratricopeptide repeat protein [Archangium gephyra]|uniref:tetratricopeptide repeat protein n=1 Tax=Archangium gephyra TaxID=48 RepID=UPI0020130829|nr:tetratricopeptide repeat protein [Archangium gephyra]
MVILTAITLEYQAALQVEDGAWVGSRWEQETGPNGLPVAFRTFYGKGSRGLRVAVAQAGDMGGVAATNALLPLVAAYSPRCVAMCGVCAGRPGKTNLGDVIAAERLFFHDTGKRLPEEVQQDLKTYNLRDDWKVALEHFDFVAHFRDEEWWKTRPIPYEWQENWVLAKLHEGVAEPSALPECHEACPQWEKVIESLWTSGHVQDGALILTEEGRRRIGRILIKQRNRFPDIAPSGSLVPFKVHVAPMGSGNQVVEDEEVWSFISEYMRKTLGLEMEAAAIGALAHAQRDRKLEALVMKGVMDFANHGRDDHFKEFATRASAECLLAFLRENLDVEVVPGVDDILVPGTEETLPENPPPSALLNARYEVVPFHERGREEILTELGRWCDEGPPVAVRLLHAEGGVGKTRLAMEWARRRRAMEWVAGFLPKEVPSDWFERLWSLGQPVLVVIDYAESFSELSKVLLRVLRYSKQEGMGGLRRMRLLLLARNSSDWWQDLRKADTSLMAWLDATPPRELPALAMKLAERERVFHEAAERFATKRGKVYVKGTPVSLSGEHFERVLYLHMAALASVEGLPFEANTLMEVILDHEERFWNVRAQQAGVSVSLQRSLARQMVAAATLRGGFADFSDATAVASRLLGHPFSTKERELLLLLQRVYQRTKEKSSMFLPALEPDLLGEGVVLRVSLLGIQGERPPSDWIDRVFPPDEESHVVRTGLDVLGRISATNHDVARPWLKRLLAGPLQSRALLALKSAKAIGLRTSLSVIGDILAERLVEDGDVALARELERTGIPESTISLRRVAEWTTRTLLQALPDSDEERVVVERARLSNNLGANLSELGKREEALEVTRKAVEAYRALAARNPDVFRSYLAKSLDNLGNRLSEQGRRQEALEATREALELHRALAARNPDTFRPYLAANLNNLGVRLGELGKREEALEATREAVELRRALAKRNPDAFQPYLAKSLNNLGARLSEQGRMEEALEAAREAVEAYRALAKRNPDGFRLYLAMSLNNLGAMLIGPEREEALAVTREAVETYRALAERNPDAFQPYLAVGLNNLGARLGEQGRSEEALEVAREAFELHRSLAERNPDVFRPYLAVSLSSLGARLSELGRKEEALDATREAVELRRAMAERNPDTFRPNLAKSLNNLGARLSELGRREEALEATREAVELRRAMAERNPDAFRPDLAVSLNSLGARLSELGRREEALEATREAVELRRALAERNPDAFRPDLAMSLNNLGSMLSEQGRREEALATAEEAIELLWPFFEQLPIVFEEGIGLILQLLLELHESLQRSIPSVLQERIAIFRRGTKP